MITPQEKTRLREIAHEIAQKPLMCIPKAAKAIEDFALKDQETIRWLHKIFWIEIPKMSIGKIFDEVTTIGGDQKAEAIADAVSKLRVRLSDVMYVGDSITDVEAFQLVRENGGLTVSFNGNDYAVRNAEVAVLSENNVVTAVIADVFCRKGKQAALNLVENWNLQALEHSGVVNLSLLDQLFSLYPQTLPKVQIVTAKNMETLVKESSEFRKKVRGEAIGRLG
jgi:energy-converting hydrogenase A subunit R